MEGSNRWRKSWWKLTEIIFSTCSDNRRNYTYRVKNGTVSKELKTWMNWAEKKVSWYDLLINDPDPLLTDHHKTYLFKDFLKEWQ